MEGDSKMKTKKLTFKQWLVHVYNLKFEVYMETSGEFKEQCRKEFAQYVIEMTGGELGERKSESVI